MNESSPGRILHFYMREIVLKLKSPILLLFCHKSKNNFQSKWGSIFEYEIVVIIKYVFAHPIAVSWQLKKKICVRHVRNVIQVGLISLWWLS